MIAKSLAPRPSFVALSLAAVVIFAHPARGQSWRGHISVGMSSSTYTGESDNEFTYRSSIAGGGGVTFDVNQFLALRGELIYAVRGAFSENTIIDGEQTELDARFSVAYVDLPLLAIGRVPTRGFAPYLFAGVALSRNVDARLTLISPTGAEVTDEDSSIAQNEFSLIGGAGIDLEVGSQEVFVEGRFLAGQPNIRPERADAPLHNRSFLFVAGVRF